VNDQQSASDRPAFASTVLADMPPENVGTVIGPYKLLQQIGHGGFGVVYMAQQEKPIRRMVALKIIKPGMDSAQVIARFESERQALALMDHANIAKVLDAGTTRSGHPYFVMELVKGVPITEFCDKNHLTPDARLKLFADVCRAIHHAHQKGIIHRDIKPSNVMVTLQDGVAVVKVIDFGVAKATAQKLTEKTLFTAYGQMVGTPEYMSPEQAEMSGLEIDTRTDVYSLGVLLYELLTGTTPIEAKQLREAGFAKMQRMIQEEQPPRPSTRLSSLRDTATVVAGNRGLEPKRLVQLVAGDLDCVVMKALEKDRNRRYASPESFADDIERYLQNEPIQARPPSVAYRLKKRVQRNRVAALTLSAVTLGLVTGTVISTWKTLTAPSAEKPALADAPLGSKQQANLDSNHKPNLAHVFESYRSLAIGGERRVNMMVYLQDFHLEHNPRHMNIEESKKLGKPIPKTQLDDAGSEIKKILDTQIDTIEEGLRTHPMLSPEVLHALTKDTDRSTLDKETHYSIIVYAALLKQLGEVHRTLNAATSPDAWQGTYGTYIHGIKEGVWNKQSPSFHKAWLDAIDACCGRVSDLEAQLEVPFGLMHTYSESVLSADKEFSEQYESAEASQQQGVQHTTQQGKATLQIDADKK
jgi:serine/threonine protein kinase